MSYLCFHRSTVYVLTLVRGMTFSRFGVLEYVTLEDGFCMRLVNVVVAQDESWIS